MVGEPLRATAERCLQQLAKHPRGPQELRRYDSFLIFQLVRAFKEQGIDVPASFDVKGATDVKGGLITKTKTLIVNDNTEVVFNLVRLIWPELKVEGFRKSWFYKDDIVE